MESKILVKTIMVEGSVTRARILVRHVLAVPSTLGSVVLWLPCNITISGGEQLMKMRMENALHF